MVDPRKEREEWEKKGAIELPKEQMKIEAECIRHYNDTAAEITNKPARHLLSMLQLDSRRHLEICRIAIHMLEGEDILEPEKEDIRESLRHHIELEKESVEMRNKLLKSTWIKENKGLSELIKRFRDDEKRQHTALKKLVDKPFYRIDPFNVVAKMRDPKFLEDRYRRGRDIRRNYRD
jgi:rubrerythrin